MTPRVAQKRKRADTAFQRKFSCVFWLGVLAVSCSDGERCSYESSVYTTSVAVPTEGAAGAAGEANGGGGSGADTAAGGSASADAVDCWTLCNASQPSPNLISCSLSSPGRVSCSFSTPPARVCYGAGVTPGRRPAGFVQAACDSATLGELFAVMAQLEAASVLAFERLAAELGGHRAPPALCRRARRAARDEVRHTRQMSGLARAHGAVSKAVDCAQTAPRSLLDIALENEVEGCVREAYSALVARFQSEFAGAASVRRIAQGLAPDEAEHAALSFAVSRWLRPQLTLRERRLIDRERARAFAELELELGLRAPESWHEQAGLPRPREARRLLAALRSNLQELADVA